MKRIIAVCERCGDDNVSIDAPVYWNAFAQCWEPDVIDTDMSGRCASCDDDSAHIVFIDQD